MRTHCRTIQNHFKNLILQEEHYYDDRYYEYSYEYADTTEPEYIEAKAEEALENVPNQLSKRKRRQINDYPEEEAEENNETRRNDKAKSITFSQPKSAPAYAWVHSLVFFVNNNNNITVAPNSLFSAFEN